MNKIRLTGVITLTSFLILSIGVMAVSAVPTMPHRVYGDVTYDNGSPATGVNIYFENDAGNVVASDVTDDNGFYDTDEAPGLENNIPEPADKTLDIYVGNWDSDNDLQWKSRESERIDLAGVPVINQSPTAGFTFSPTSPTDGDTIQFTDQSSDLDGNIVSWSWDFGDGDTSTSQDPAHQYSDEGTYTVTLEVTDSGSPGKTDNTSQDISVSNASPTADFSFSPSSPVTDETINFDAGASSDPSPSETIKNYEWDWEADGSIDATGVTASHSFSNTGDHSVWLRVTDNDGATDTKTKTVTVTTAGGGGAPVNQSPTASFTYTPSEPTVGENVDFDATGSFDSDGTIESYDWDLDGDSQYDDATGSTTSKSFASVGDYEVGVKVTDDGNSTDSTRKTVSVSAPVNQPPNADAGGPYLVDEGGTVELDGTGSSDSDGSIVSYSWDITNDPTGEASLSDSDTATPVFSAPSVDNDKDVTVSLTVTDDNDATDNASTVVTVKSFPQAPSPEEIENMPSENAAENLANSDPLTATETLENVIPDFVGDIIDEAVKSERTEDFVDILRRMSPSAASRGLLEAIPSNAARVMESMVSTYPDSAAKIADAGAKTNLDNEASILNEMGTESAASLLIRIYNLPSTPEAAASLLGAMNLDNNIAVIQDFIESENYSYADGMFKHLTNERLNDIWEGLTQEQKNELKPHLSSGVKNRITALKPRKPFPWPTVVAVIIVIIAVVVASAWYWQSGTGPKK